MSFDWFSQVIKKSHIELVLVWYKVIEITLLLCMKYSYGFWNYSIIIIIIIIRISLKWCIIQGTYVEIEIGINVGSDAHSPAASIFMSLNKTL